LHTVAPNTIEDGKSPEQGHNITGTYATALRQTLDHLDIVTPQNEEILGPNDMVTSPDHYTKMWPGDIETIDVIGAVLDYIDNTTAQEVSPRQLHCLGCMLKYLFRAPFKDNETQDLEKAIAYIKLGGWND